MAILEIIHLVKIKSSIEETRGQDQPFTPLASNEVKEKLTPNGTTKVNGNGSNVSVPLKPIHNNVSVATQGALGRGTMPGGLPTPGYQDPRYGYDGMRSSVPWFDASLFSAGQHRPATSSSISSTASSFQLHFPWFKGTSLLSFAMLCWTRRRRKQRAKYFLRNGGLLLKQCFNGVQPSHDATLFSASELNMATTLYI